MSTKAVSPANDATIWHLASIGGASVMNADFTAFHFAPHYHEELAIGVIQRGKLNVKIGHHHRLTLLPGQLVIINPGEIHEGFTEATDGCFYRMFYLPTTLLAQVIETSKGSPPHFSQCAIHDTQTAQQLTWLHRHLTAPASSPLQRESELLEIVNGFILRHADAIPQGQAQIAADAHAIHHAKAYLAAYCHQKIRLATLAAEVGHSPFYLLRMFKTVVGMTPHAFQMQMRIDRAKAQLLRGEAIAQVAVDLGFYDQSHLTKHFKALLGVTPQRFRQHRNFLQDNSAPAS